jgi:Ca2+/H+ antiporter, TMEM165/GDT1 family
MKRFRVLKVVGFVVLGIAGLFLFSAIVMLLWNNLLPTLFHLPIINLWQALGLLVLAKLLFGGLGGGNHRRPWRHKMQQKWMNMSPEEREKLRQEWGNRCGGRFQEERTAQPSNQQASPMP